MQYYYGSICNDVEETDLEPRTAVHRQAITLHESQWRKIKKHASNNKYEKQLQIYHEKFQNYLKRGSQSITENWRDNLVNNAREKLEKMMRDKAREGHQMTVEEFLELKRKRTELSGEEAEIRDRFLKETEMVLRTNKPGPKMLDSALLMSNVIFERDKQMEFKEHLHSKEKRKETKYGEYIKQDAKKYYVEEMEKRNRRLQEYDDYKKKLYNQKLQIEENRKRQQQRTIEEEIEDLRKAAKQLEIVKKIEEDKILSSKIKARVNYLTSMQLKRAEEERLRKLDDVENQIIQKSLEADKRLQAITSMRQNMIMELNRQRIEDVAKKTYALTKPDYSKEEESRMKAKAEKDEKFYKEEAQKREQRKRLAEERRKSQEEYIRQKEYEEHKIRERKKWGLMNLKKNREITEELKDRIEKRALEIMHRNNIDWAQQMEEQQMLREKELEMDRVARKKVDDEFKRQDDHFLKYAEQLLTQCESDGRPLYPLHVAINQYKTQNKIGLKTTIPRHLITKVPINNKNEKTSLI